MKTTRRATAREWQDLVLAALPCGPATEGALLKAAREQLRLTLPDGTRITLPIGARLTIEQVGA